LFREASLLWADVCDLRLVGGASWALACWAGPRTGRQLAKLESGPPED